MLNTNKSHLELIIASLIVAISYSFCPLTIMARVFAHHVTNTAHSNLTVECARVANFIVVLVFLLQT